MTYVMGHSVYEHMRLDCTVHKIRGKVAYETHIPIYLQKDSYFLYYQSELAVKKSTIFWDITNAV
jgi:hypothetical protein